eukprot:g2950.t1
MKDIVISCFRDYLFTYSMFGGAQKSVSDYLKEKKLSEAAYVANHQPAVSWILLNVVKSMGLDWDTNPNIATSELFRLETEDDEEMKANGNGGSDTTLIISSTAQTELKSCFVELLRHYRDYASESSPMTLKHIIENFPATLYSSNVGQIVQLMKEHMEGAKSSTTNTDGEDEDAKDKGTKVTSNDLPFYLAKTEASFSTPVLFATLAAQLSLSPPPQRQRLSFLNDTWKVITKLGPQVEEMYTYLHCVHRYLPLILRHYSDKEVLIVLKDLNRHLKKHIKYNRAENEKNKGETVLLENKGLVEPILHLISLIAQVLVRECRSFSVVLTSDHFLNLLDLLGEADPTSVYAQRKQAINFCLLRTFVQHSGTTKNTLLLQTMLSVGREMHDELDSLSGAGDRKKRTQIIMKFVEKIDFHSDLEQQLNAYVDCRAIFSNMEAVKVQLVNKVASLLERALVRLREAEENGDTTTTAQLKPFMKACLAFSHVTIAAVENELQRVRLFNSAASAALKAGFLPQADTLYKAAISGISQMPEILEGGEDLGLGGEVTGIRIAPRLIALIKMMLSALIQMPGHPDIGATYLLSGLYKALNTKELIAVKMQFVPVLVALAQSELPYRVEKIASNDILYGGDKEYRIEIEAQLSQVINEVIDELLEEKNECGPMMCLDFLNIVAANVYMGDQKEWVENLLHMVDTMTQGEAKGSSILKYVENTKEWIIEQLKD